MTEQGVEGPGGAERAAAAKPLRADARRNREAVLRAAREAFEVEGALTSLDGIAARAGVGNATLYRHFPTRDDLLVAVMRDSIDEAVHEAEDLSRTLAPREALGEWLARLTWRLRVWHDLPLCLADAREGSASPVQSACDPLLDVTGDLLARARTADVAADGAVGPEEVWELVLALSWAVDRFDDDEAAARRRVRLGTAGLLA